MGEITEKQRDFLDTATHVLDDRASDPEYPYWLYDIGDEGLSFCLDCVKNHIGQSFDFSKDIGERFGGGYSCESDGCEHCEECGKLLDYTLTDYGIKSELSHFEDYPHDWNNADDCYELAQIAHSIGGNYDQERTLIHVLLSGLNFPVDELPPTLWKGMRV